MVRRLADARVGPRPTYFGRIHLCTSRVKFCVLLLARPLLVLGARGRTYLLELGFGHGRRVVLSASNAKIKRKRTR